MSQVSAPPHIPGLLRRPLKLSKMELPLPHTTAYSFKSSMRKPRVLIVCLSMVLFTAMLGLLQLKFLKAKVKDFYSFEVKDIKGRTVSLEKYRGKVSRDSSLKSFRPLVANCFLCSMAMLCILQGRGGIDVKLLHYRHWAFGRKEGYGDWQVSKVK